MFRFNPKHQDEKNNSYLRKLINYIMKSGLLDVFRQISCEYIVFSRYLVVSQLFFQNKNNYFSGERRHKQYNDILITYQRTGSKPYALENETYNLIQIITRYKTT